MWDMHSEAWWIKALDGELSPAEQQLWEQHLGACRTCRVEWAALARLEIALRAAPIPVPPVDFAPQTTMRALAARRQRRLWLLGVSVLTILLGAGIVLGFGAVYWDFSRLLSAVIFSKDVLVQALMRTVVGLMVAGRSFAPLVLCGAAALLFLFMPNGMLATVAVVLVRRRREIMRNA